jgi:hypothetical protein
MTVLYNYIINYLLRTAFFSRGPWFILFFIRKELDIGVFSIPHGMGSKSSNLVDYCRLHLQLQLESHLFALINLVLTMKLK